MPAREEFVAHGCSEQEIGRKLGVDWLLYQDLRDLEASVRCLNPNIRSFDTSCFDGEYVTGDIDASYLQALEDARKDAKKSKRNRKFLRSVGSQGASDIQSGGGFRHEEA